MTDQNRIDAEGWDPDEAKEKMSAKKLKMPITFLRTDSLEPNMEMETTVPPEKEIEATKPKIVHRPKSGRNNGALF